MLSVSQKVQFNNEPVVNNWEQKANKRSTLLLEQYLIILIIDNVNHSWFGASILIGKWEYNVFLMCQKSKVMKGLVLAIHFPKDFWHCGGSVPSSNNTWRVRPFFSPKCCKVNNLAFLFIYYWGWKFLEHWLERSLRSFTFYFLNSLYFHIMLFIT